MNSIKLRGVFVAVSGALMFGATGVALADTTDDLLKALRDKGVLSQDEFDTFNASRDVEKIKKSTEIKASFKDGVTFESGDKATQISMNGRIQLDYRNFDHADGVVNADTFDVRRAYLGVKGKFYNDYDFEVTADFAGQSNTSHLDVAYFGINWWEQARFRFGQYKQPFSMEELSSSRFLDFQERSFVNGQAPGKERGAMVYGKVATGLYYALGLSTGQGKNTNESTGAAAVAADSNDVIGRAYVNFAELLNDKTKVLHVGGAFSNGKLKGDNAKISQRTEGRGITFFDTAAFSATDEIKRNRAQVEAALAFGPVRFQGEYVKTNYDGRDTGGSFDRDVKAWYAEALWLITGENYADIYKDGAFGGRIKPKQDFVAPGAPGWGAWEVGVRRSKFDASDFLAASASTGGAALVTGLTTEADAWTLGLKWIPNPNTRFLLNYVKTDFDTPVTVNSVAVTNERAITMRAQFDF